MSIPSSSNYIITINAFHAVVVSLFLFWLSYMAKKGNPLPKNLYLVFVVSGVAVLTYHGYLLFQRLKSRRDNKE